MQEEFFVGEDVPVEIHAHESRKLQESGVDWPLKAWVRPGHLHDDIVAEPIEALFLSQMVDGRRVAPRVDGTAHENHGGGRVRIAPRLHQRNRRQHRNGWLAYGHHRGARTQMGEDVYEVVDVIVEVETPVR